MQDQRSDILLACPNACTITFVVYITKVIENLLHFI